MTFELCKIDWTAIAAVASLIMVIATFLTLLQNRRQVRELKRQWSEQNKPIIIYDIQEFGSWFFLVIKNIGNSPAYDFQIKLSGDFLVYPNGEIRCKERDSKFTLIYKDQEKYINLAVLGANDYEFIKGKVLIIEGEYTHNKEATIINKRLTYNHNIPQQLKRQK